MHKKISHSNTNMKNRLAKVRYVQHSTDNPGNQQALVPLTLKATSVIKAKHIQNKSE